MHRSSRDSHQLLIVLSDGRGVFMDGALVWYHSCVWLFLLADLLACTV